MSALVVVTNPRSRQNRRDPTLAQRLTAALAGHGELAQPTDLAAMRALAERLHAERPEVVAIHGGDGTSHVVLSALARAYGSDPLPAICLLPGGTMNTVARGVGVRGAGLRVLERLLRAREAGTSPAHTTRSLLRVSSPGHPDAWFGFLFGNGLISNYLEAYYEGSEPTPVKALLVLGRGILSAFVNGAFFRRLMRPVQLACAVEGADWADRPYLAIGVGTVDDIGFGFRPFFEAVRNPGSLHALGIACPPLSFVFELPRIRLARPTAHPDIRTAVTSFVRMRSAAPIAFMVDGDFCVGGTELTVDVGPTVRLLLP